MIDRKRILTFFITIFFICALAAAFIGVKTLYGNYKINKSYADADISPKSVAYIDISFNGYGVSYSDKKSNFTIKTSSGIQTVISSLKRMRSAARHSKGYSDCVVYKMIFHFNNGSKRIYTHTLDVSQTNEMSGVLNLPEAARR